MSFTGTSPHPDVEVFQGGMVPTSLSFHQAGHVIPNRPGPDVNHDWSNALHSSDVDLGGELYVRKQKSSGTLSGSGSDSRSRTSTSFSAGDTSHIQNHSRGSWLILHGLEADVRRYPMGSTAMIVFAGNRLDFAFALPVVADSPSIHMTERRRVPPG
ncbi:hypothetical protein L210DRAFT_977713 [Boletus edulis BED1]|uniref:Uncharacterized protein n=1 Tax=Boletus edulis BED1 TaxID=1328754 RepID=A0AAD4G5U0_BOLED|nr:hypothetical protein L210DRAFT_977713 [Boletus edulis BED1]